MTFLVCNALLPPPIYIVEASFSRRAVRVFVSMLMMRGVLCLVILRRHEKRVFVVAFDE